MISKELLAVTEEFNKVLKDTDASQRETMLAQTVKLGEEIGELCEAVIDICNWQREDKDETDIESEFADVILTTLVLANTCGVDINKALEAKVDKLQKRFSL